MREVDQTALRVPDVFAVHDDVVAFHGRHPWGDRGVVLDFERQVLCAELDDELLVGPRTARSIGEQPDDRAIGRDLDVGLMVLKIRDDRGVIRRAARRRDVAGGPAGRQQ